MRALLKTIDGNVDEFEISEPRFMPKTANGSLLVSFGLYVGDHNGEPYFDIYHLNKVDRDHDLHIISRVESRIRNHPVWISVRATWEAASNASKAANNSRLTRVSEAQRALIRGAAFGAVRGATKAVMVPVLFAVVEQLLIEGVFGNDTYIYHAINDPNAPVFKGPEYFK